MSICKKIDVFIDGAHHETVIKFAKLIGITNEEYIVIFNSSPLFEKSAIYVGVSSQIFKGEIAGKTAYRIDYDDGGFFIILDEPNNYKFYMKEITKLFKAEKYILVKEYNESSNIFKPIFKLKDKLFTWIRDDNWNTASPYLDEFMTGKKVRRLNIFLHGVPGTGKTSFAYQIAMYCRNSVCNVSLRDLSKSRVSIPAHSILLIEDIDKALVGGDLADDANITALLSILDGILSDKVIVVCTSSKSISSCKDILVSRNKIDLALKFGNANREQVHALLGKWYPDTNIDKVVCNLADKLTVAELNRALKSSYIQDLTIHEVLEKLSSEFGDSPVTRNSSKSDHLCYI